MTTQNFVTLPREVVDQMLEVERAYREYVEAIPEGTVLPAMPGFDRDWADTVVSRFRRAALTEQAHPKPSSLLTDKELADPEYMRSYVDELHATAQPANPCKLSECRGMPRCNRCLSWDKSKQVQPAQGELIFYADDHLVSQFLQGGSGGMWVTTAKYGSKNTPLHLQSNAERVPLSDERIDELWEEWKGAFCLDHKTWARAIEAEIKKGQQ